MAMCHNEQSASLLWFHRKQAAPRQSSSKLGSALGLHCFSRLELSALHLIHSDTPPEIYLKSLF